MPSSFSGWRSISPSPFPATTGGETPLPFATTPFGLDDRLLSGSERLAIFAAVGDADPLLALSSPLAADSRE